MATLDKSSADLTETVNVSFVSEKPATQGAVLIIAGSGQDYDSLYPDAGLKAVAETTGFEGKTGQKFSAFIAQGNNAVQIFVRARGDKDTFDYEMAVAETAKAPPQTRFAPTCFNQ